MKSFFNHQENTMPDLITANSVAKTDLQKAQALNDFFVQCSIPNEEKFAEEKEYHQEIERKVDEACDSEIHSNFCEHNDQITIHEVVPMVYKMKADGTAGPDGIHPCMLKNGHKFLFERLAELFDIDITQMSGKMQTFVQFTKKEIKMFLTIIAQSVSHLFWEN